MDFAIVELPAPLTNGIWIKWILSSVLYPVNNDEALEKAFKFLKSSVSMPPALLALFRLSDKHINPSNSDFSLG